MGLEADLRVADLRRTKPTQLPSERGIAARVPVVALQLSVEVGAAKARTDGQAPLDVAQLDFAEGGGFIAQWVLAGSGALDLALDGPPVQPELAG